MKFFLSIILILFCASAYCQKIVPDNYAEADRLFRLGKYDEASSLFSNILKKDISDSLKAELYMRIAEICFTNDRIDSSISLLQSAIIIWKEENNKLKLSRSLQNIGNYYFFKKKYPESLSYLNEALGNAVSASDSVKIYISLAVMHLKQKHYDTAYSILKNEMSKYPVNLVPYQAYYINEGTGVYFLHLNNYDSALVNFKKAIPFAPDARYKQAIYNDLSETYRRMKNYPVAFRYQDSASINNGIEGWAENLQLNYDNYAQLYKETGNYKQALLYADSGRHLSDSIFNIENTKAITEAEAKYQNEKARAENIALEKDKAKQQQKIVYALIVLSVVALLAFAAFRVSRLRKKANRILSVQKQQVQELADKLSIANETKSRLFSTISHDLRGPVSSLYAVLKMQELKEGDSSPAISGHTVHLLDTLEELLIWSKSQLEGFVLQPVTIRINDLFAELEKFYNSSALVRQVKLQSSPTDIVIKTDENILKSVLRNAISNAITHTSAGLSVRLEAVKADTGNVCISVINPCSEEDFNQFQLSFKESKIQSRSSGFGIVLMKEFTDKIGAKLELRYRNNEATVNLFL